MLLIKYVVMLLVLVTKLPMNKLLVFGSMSPLSESKNKTNDPVHRRFLNLTVGFQSVLLVAATKLPIISITSAQSQLSE